MNVDELSVLLDDLAGPTPMPTPVQTATFVQEAARARRRRVRIRVATCLVAVAVAIGATLVVRADSSSPSVNAPADTPDSTQITPAAGTVTAVGDSVMLQSTRELEAAITDRFDGQVNPMIVTRENLQLSDALPVLRAARDRGELDGNVVLHIGTNGAIDAALLEELLALTDASLRVVVVNDKAPRSWQAPNNQTIKEVVDRHDNAVVLDWYAYSSARPELFAPDGIRVGRDGALRYAALIADALDTSGQRTSRQASLVRPGPDAEARFTNAEWVGTASRTGTVVGYVPGPASPRNGERQPDGSMAVYRRADGSGGIVGYLLESGFVSKEVFESPGFDIATENARSRDEIEIAARVVDPSFSLAATERRLSCNTFESIGVECPPESAP